LVSRSPFAQFGVWNFQNPNDFKFEIVSNSNPKFQTRRQEGWPINSAAAAKHGRLRSPVQLTAASLRPERSLV
jgi:hypothetical protein